MAGEALRGLDPKTDNERIAVGHLDRLIKALERDDVSPEFANAVQGKLTEVRAAVNGVVDGATSGISSVEAPTEKRLSFAEAAELFGNKRIDVGGKVVEGLPAMLKEMVKMYRRMGLEEALKRKGSSLDVFGAQLQDSTEPSEADLKAIIAEANAEGVVPWTPTLEGGPLLPGELWDELFVKADILYWRNTYGTKNIGNARRVTLEHFEQAGYNLKDLIARNDWNEQIAAFKAAHQKAPEWRQSDGRLIFTPDTTEVSRTGISATQDLANGTRTLDIDANMIRFMTFVEKGLRTLADRQGIDFENMPPADYKRFKKACFQDRSIEPFLPDRTHISRSSRCVLPNGGVAALDWSPGIARSACTTTILVMMVVTWARVPLAVSSFPKNLGALAP